MLAKLVMTFAKVHLDMGVGPSMTAFILGIFSGISMPIACVLGIWMSPLNDRLNGCILAFGAGSLIFAVTVSIFGHALTELAEGEAYRYQDFAAIFGGLCGSLFFLRVAQWLEEDPSEEPKGAAEAQLLHATEATPLTNARRNSGLAARGKSGSLADAALIMDARRSDSKGLADDENKQAEARAKKDRFVAIALFAGLLIDGIPEGIFMGFMAAENNLTLSLIVALFIANFPEAFSSAALLYKTGMGMPSIMAMWGGLCILVGALAGISCAGLLFVFPSYAYGAKLPPIPSVFVALVDGFTGGAMLSCICSVMLPESHHLVGKGGPIYFSSGFLSVAGFLCSVALEVTVASVENGTPLLKSIGRIFSVVAGSHGH